MSDREGRDVEHDAGERPLERAEPDAGGGTPAEPPTATAEASPPTEPLPTESLPTESRHGWLAWFASNSVASNLLMLLLVLGGAIALFSVTIEVFPDVAIDTVTVRVPYLGAAPAEVEEGVNQRVEEAIAGIEGIEKIRSVAREGNGTVIAELDEDADRQYVLDEVKAAVDRIETFPAETEKPVVSETVSRRQVITLVLSGDLSEKALKELAETAYDELTAKALISQIDFAGIRRYEISVEVPEENLRRYGLTFDQVAAAVRRGSLDLPGGSIETEGGEILVRTKSQKYRGEEFERIVVVSRPDGTLVRLGDVATVVDGFEDSDIGSQFDGRPAALLKVYRVGDQGALDVAAAVREYAEELEARLPPGVETAVWEDNSVILRSRLSLLLRNAAIGLVLVFLSLALFLDLRLAFWTTMGIPISFLGGVLLLPWLGISINMISLFAFIVALGIVVDDAIVVGENVYRWLEEGARPLDAAIRGVREMAIPVTFAILTTVTAFAPLLFAEGRIGRIMRNIPAVVIAVLVISLVEALLILPAHLASSHGLPRALRMLFGPLLHGIEWVRSHAQRGLQRLIDGPYSRALERAVEWRYLTVAIGLAFLMLAFSFVAGGFLRFTFMPEVDSDNLIGTVTLQQGTPLQRTEEVVEQLEAAVREVQREFDERGDFGEERSIVQYVASTIGQQPSTGNQGPFAMGAGASGSHLAEVNVQLMPSEERGFSSTEMAARWRELVGEIPGAKEVQFTSSLFTAGKDVNVELSHRRFDTLLAAVADLKSKVAEYPGIAELSDTFQAGKQEMKLDLTDEGRAAGLTVSDLARQVRAAFYGEEAQRIQRGRDDVRVMVRYPADERRSLADIEKLRIRLPDGRELPFANVATVEIGRGYALINRTDRRRVVSVTADVDETIANANEINADLRATVLPQLVRDFPGLSYDFEGAQREQSDTMTSLGLNFLYAQLAIFALLAIPFRSYTQPLIVMSAIPFGFVGAIGGHVIMGLDLSMLSMFGIVALTGVVVNDSLIMIDLINRERAEGLPLAQVIRDSGVKRFRPILLTTLTTFLGLTPMILETSLQARFLIPMAVSLGFGVLFATFITLFLVPSLYMILEDLHRLVLGRDTARQKARERAEALAGPGGLGEEPEPA